MASQYPVVDFSEPCGFLWSSPWWRRTSVPLATWTAYLCCQCWMLSSGWSASPPVEKPVLGGLVAETTSDFRCSINGFFALFSDGSDVVTLGYTQAGIVTEMGSREKCWKWLVYDVVLHHLLSWVLLVSAIVLFFVVIHLSISLPLSKTIVLFIPLTTQNNKTSRHVNKENHYQQNPSTGYNK